MPPRLNLAGAALCGVALAMCVSSLHLWGSAEAMAPNKICPTQVEVYYWTWTSYAFRTEKKKQNKCCEGFRPTKKTPLGCDSSCSNGCIVPSNCQLNYKYQCRGCEIYYNFQQSECIAMCPHDCTQGCKEPNICSCSQGHTYNVSKKSCVPVCTHDVNCECTGPETCPCNIGYHSGSKAGKCIPDCPDTCKHGTCSEPNNCTCDKGYRNDSRNGSICIPECPETCTNGTCNDPNNCTCNQGYKKHSGNNSECVPECPETCTQDTCSEPNNCTCYEGYGKNDAGNDSICVPGCGSQGSRLCAAPGECRCPDGNGTSRAEVEGRGNAERGISSAVIGASVATAVGIMVAIAALICWRRRLWRTEAKEGVGDSEPHLGLQNWRTSSRRGSERFEENSLYGDHHPGEDGNLAYGSTVATEEVPEYEEVYALEQR